MMATVEGVQDRSVSVENPRPVSENFETALTRSQERALESTSVVTERQLLKHFKPQTL